MGLICPHALKIGEWILYYEDFTHTHSYPSKSNSEKCHTPSSENSTSPNTQPQQTRASKPQRQEQERNTSTKACLSQALPPGKELPRGSWDVRENKTWYTSIDICVSFYAGPCCLWVGSGVRRPSRSPPLMPPFFLYSAHPGDRRHSCSMQGMAAKPQHP